MNDPNVRMSFSLDDDSENHVDPPQRRGTDRPREYNPAAQMLTVWAGIAAVLAYALPLKLNIVLAIAMAVVACLMAEQLKALKASDA